MQLGARLAAGDPPMRKAVLTGVGGVAAAFLGSLCCVGPLLFVTLGVGAGLASTFEPLRPLFGAAMLALLGIGFWTVYGHRLAVANPATRPPTEAQASDATCPPTTECAMSTRRGRDVALLWGATVLALIFWTFPAWSLWFL